MVNGSFFDSGNYKKRESVSRCSLLYFDNMISGLMIELQLSSVEPMLISTSALVITVKIFRK